MTEVITIEHIYRYIRDNGNKTIQQVGKRFQMRQALVQELVLRDERFRIDNHFFIEGQRIEISHFKFGIIRFNR